MRKFPSSLAPALLFSLVACESSQVTGPAALSGDAAVATTTAKKPTTGNGAPSGSHYQLTIKGTESDSLPARAANQRHTLFVRLHGTCDIGLTEGDFQVIDYTCLDGDPALFQLPDPADQDGDGLLEYSVYIRAVSGKGSATLQTCFTDASGTWCNSGDLIVVVYKTEPPTYTNSSQALLQACSDDDNDPNTPPTLVPLFDDSLINQWWRYDNNGIRTLQMRFYPIETTPQGGPCERTAAEPMPPQI